MPATTNQTLIKNFNPVTGECIFEIQETKLKEINEKIQKARNSFYSWSNLSIENRISYIKNIYDQIIKDREKIAKIITLNSGKPLAESYLTEIASVLQISEYFIKNGSSLLSEKSLGLGPLYPTKKSFMSYEPLGVFVIIEPWNYPFYLPLSAIVKTLVAGNTFIFKPSSEVAYTGKLIEDILKNSGLPDGVANVIYGSSLQADELLKGEIDKVIFTGSTEVGKKIVSNCAERLVPVSLELGGKDPAIVLKNANLDYACGGILWGAISNCGQACASIERVYVQSDIYDEFIEKISVMTQSLKIGDGMDEETDVGPLINEKQITKIEEHISDAVSKGAKIHTGGKRLGGKGFYFEPTVLSNVNHQMKIMKEETFGPAIPVMKFETEEEVIKLANDSHYGLSASIWTGAPDAAVNLAKKLNCGTVWINDSLFQQAHPACPWQGYKESGYGGSSIYDFVREKHISIDRGFIPKLRPKSFWWFPYKGKAKSYSDLIEIFYKHGIKEKAKAAFNTLVDFLR